MNIGPRMTSMPPSFTDFLCAAERSFPPKTRFLMVLSCWNVLYSPDLPDRCVHLSTSAVGPSNLSIPNLEDSKDRTSL